MSARTTPGVMLRAWQAAAVLGLGAFTLHVAFGFGGRERRPELQERVLPGADLALSVARRLGLTSGELEQVRRAAELRDVGTIAIPDEILLKAFVAMTSDRPSINPGSACRTPPKRGDAVRPGLGRVALPDPRAGQRRDRGCVAV